MGGLFGYAFGIHDEESASTAFVLVFALMMVTVITVADYLVGHHLNSRLPFHIPESGVTMFIGILIGAIISGADHEEITENPLVTFSSSIFFLAFLPPIIFNEGYHLKQQFFFGYIKEILIFAVLGTGLSAIIMAAFVYNTPGREGDMMSFAEAASFGGLISATDPVAVLAILGQLRVEPALFYLVFGESVLNDAVSLTIFNIASKFVGASHGAGSVGVGVVDFVIILIGSCAIGYLVPCFTTMLLRRVDLRGHVILEMSVYLLMSYVPFALAEIVGMSGIVAILMAGITTRSYTHRNLSSRKTQDFADFFFRLCSFLADNAVFVYLGMTVTGLKDIRHEFDFGFVGWAFFGCVVSRAVVVLVLSQLINYLAQYSNLNKISRNHQFVLWFAGLRGAVAFAAATSFPDVNGKRDLVITTTMGIIIVFTFVAAPLTMPVIVKLGMPLNVEYDTSRPPRMPRLVRWLHNFDEKFIDHALIRRCAQRGGPCEYYHLDKGCPSQIFTLHGDHGGHDDHDEHTGQQQHDEDDHAHGTTPTLTPTNAEAAAAHNSSTQQQQQQQHKKKGSMANGNGVELTAAGGGGSSSSHHRRVTSVHARRPSGAAALVNDRTPEADVYNYGGPVSPDRTGYGGGTDEGGQGLHARGVGARTNEL